VHGFDIFKSELAKRATEDAINFLKIKFS